MSAEVSEVDRRMLRWAPYKSPEEISELMGGTVTPSEVASRVQTLLRSRSWLSTLQKKQILNDRLWEMMDVYWDWAMNGSLKSAEVVFKSVQEIRKLLSEDSVSIEDAVTMITEADAERMGRAMALAFTKQMEILAVPEPQALEALNVALPLAMAEVDAAVVHD